VTGFSDILPALHALLSTFLGAAERDMSLPKLGRLTRTICRLARIIMSIDVYIYQSKVKAEMLADVNWRNRVINELGGYPALREWQARFYAGPLACRTKPFMPRPCGAAARKPSARQFCLAPLPRATFDAHRSGDAADDLAPSKPIMSGFDKPIPLEPCELWPAVKKQRERAAPCYSAEDFEHYHQICKAPAGEWLPP